MFEYDLPISWDAKKFATRYGLDSFKDFYVRGSKIVVIRQLPDDPPIFDLPSPEILAPAGLFIHEMKALTSKIDNKLENGRGTASLMIVAENELLLSDPFMTGIQIDTGSTAYIVDKAKTLTWDGTKWK